MRIPVILAILASCASPSTLSSAPPPSDAGETPSDASDAALDVVEESPPDFSRTLAAYETPYDAPGNRGKNVRLAASKLDGMIIAAGDTFSFNTTVGPRTLARGFVEAKVIFKGEMTPGLGGGVCQVSSTLHAAALMAGLEIVERSPHTRPSGYIPMGLDSTVTIAEECADPNSHKCYMADLRIRNPLPFPVQITFEPYAGKRHGQTLLRAEIHGAEDGPGKTAYFFTVKDVKPFERRVRESEDAGAPTMVQKGIVGRTVTSKVVFKDRDASVETYESIYPPTDEVWEIPIGFEGDLPLDAGLALDGGAG